MIIRVFRLARFLLLELDARYRSEASQWRHALLAFKLANVLGKLARS